MRVCIAIFGFGLIVLFALLLAPQPPTPTALPPPTQEELDQYLDAQLRWMEKEWGHLPEAQWRPDMLERYRALRKAKDDGGD